MQNLRFSEGFPQKVLCNTLIRERRVRRDFRRSFLDFILHDKVLRAGSAILEIFGLVFMCTIYFRNSSERTAHSLGFLAGYSRVYIT